MIMAGRGRRLLDSGDDSKKIGKPLISTDNSPVDLMSLAKKISEIDLSNNNPSLLNNIESMFKEIFTSKPVVQDVLIVLHSRALTDAKFGESLIHALQPVLLFEVDGTLLRSELLSLIQNDFKTKEEMFKSNREKFINSVMLLGNVYNTIKVSGKAIAILGPALLNYFDLLLQGEEKEMKTLAKQILINGKKLSEIDSYKQLVQSLRDSLVNRNLNSLARCWLLLAIDLTSNGFQPLKEPVRDFYVKKLGDEYLIFEKLTHTENHQIMPSPVPSDEIKTQESVSPKITTVKSSPRKTDNFKSSNERKVQSSPSKHFKNDSWKPGAGGRNSGHDDRFEKDENFYGAQKPRQPRPINQKKRFSDDKSNKKNFDHFETGVDEKSSPQLNAANEEHELKI